jgi:hypothetical protein
MNALVLLGFLLGFAADPRRAQRGRGTPVRRRSARLQRR